MVIILSSVVVCMCLCAVLGCADLALPDGRMSVERVGDVTTVTCNSTAERWHLLCRRGQWFGAPLTNCTTRRTCIAHVYEACPKRFWPRWVTLGINEIYCHD